MHDLGHKNIDKGEMTTRMLVLFSDQLDSKLPEKEYVVKKIVKEIIHADYGYIVVKDGRDRSPEGNSPSYDKYLSHLCFYGLEGNKTGFREFDVLFQEINFFLKKGKLNELISRDEGTHTVFAIHAYNNHIQNKLSTNIVHDIMREAVEIEANFIREALPKGMLGMNSDMMTNYIKFVADNLLSELQYPKIYGVENPFPFMQKQSISVRMSDFFKSVPVEYRIAGANMTAAEQTIATDENF